MTVPDPVNLSKLDVLPPQCSLQVMVEIDDDTHTGRVRFRAVKKRKLLPDRESEWSGWFDLATAPIELKWETFWI